MSADVHSGWANGTRPKVRGNARANLAAADAIPSPDPPEGDPLAALGMIQQRVARLIGLGLSNGEIGAVMGISAQTGSLDVFPCSSSHDAGDCRRHNFKTCGEREICGGLGKFADFPNGLWCQFGASAALKINGAGHGFQVVGVHTSSIAAQVVGFCSCWERSFVSLVVDAVGGNEFPIQVHPAVTIDSDVSLPNPARRDIAAVLDDVVDAGFPARMAFDVPRELTSVAPCLTSASTEAKPIGTEKGIRSRGPGNSGAASTAVEVVVASGSPVEGVARFRLFALLAAMGGDRIGAHCRVPPVLHETLAATTRQGLFDCLILAYIRQISHMTTVFRALPSVRSSSRRLAFLIGFWEGRQEREEE